MWSLAQSELLALHLSIAFDLGVLRGTTIMLHLLAGVYHSSEANAANILQPVSEPVGKCHLVEAATKIDLCLQFKETVHLRICAPPSDPRYGPYFEKPSRRLNFWGDLPHLLLASRDS